MDLVPDTNTATSWASGLYSPTAAMLSQRWSLKTPTVQRRSVLEKDDLARVVQKANDVLANRDDSEMILLLHAKTFVSLLEEFTAAFIFGWTIIERYLADQVKHLEVGSSRKTKLSRLPVDTILEILNVSGHLPSTRYDAFMKLKDLRNQIIHNGKEATRRDAKVCIEQSERLIKEKFNIGMSGPIVLAPVN
jgi:hypothetical protein